MNQNSTLFQQYMAIIWRPVITQWLCWYFICMFYCCLYRSVRPAWSYWVRLSRQDLFILMNECKQWTVRGLCDTLFMNTILKWPLRMSATHLQVVMKHINVFWNSTIETFICIYISIANIRYRHIHPYIIWVLFHFII